MTMQRIHCRQMVHSRNLLEMSQHRDENNWFALRHCPDNCSVFIGKIRRNKSVKLQFGFITFDLRSVKKQM